MTDRQVSQATIARLQGQLDDSATAELQESAAAAADAIADLQSQLEAAEGSRRAAEAEAASLERQLERRGTEGHGAASPGSGPGRGRAGGREERGGTPELVPGATSPLPVGARHATLK